MTLPRKNKLTKKKEIDLVFGKGNALKGDFLFIKYKKNIFHEPRFVFIIPLKVYRNTVSRNRAKRVLSEFISQKIKNMAGDWVIVSVKKKGKEELLKKELNYLLNKAKILNEPISN